MDARKNRERDSRRQGANATVKVVTESLHVFTGRKKVAKPSAVRYGWASVPDVNLFNREGLPASPFRTDLPTASKSAAPQK